MGRIIVFSLTLAMSLANLCEANGDSWAMALLPLKNHAGLDVTQYRYFDDLIFSEFTQQAKGRYTVLERTAVQSAAAESADGEGGCAESCAVDVAKRLHGDVVLMTEILRLDSEMRCVMTLVDVDSGTTLSQKRVMGGDLAEMEKELPTVIGELLLALETESQQTPSTQNEGLDYGDVIVAAEGVRQSSPGSSEAVEADVYFNGKQVGTTPYMDGLPPGRYQVMMVYRDETPQIAEVAITAGEAVRVDGKFSIPLSEAEQKAMEKARYKKARRIFERRHQTWEKEAKKVTPKRRKRWILGGSAMAGGVGMVVVGSVLLVKSFKADQRADDYYDRWSRVTTQEDIDRYAGKVRNLESSRDTQRTAGVALLSVGGAVALSGIVMAVLAPKVPEEPTFSTENGKVRLSGLIIQADPYRRSALVGAGVSF